MFKQILKDRIHRTLIGNMLEGYRIEKAYRRWLDKNKPGMISHTAKQLAVKTFAQNFGIRFFIETGTYLGEMVEAVRDDFDRIYSIELSEDLFKRAERKFAGWNHITILHGDSALVLAEILRHIDAPCLFWLDGHYSAGIIEREEKETPFWKEMRYISEHPVNNHVILIDDASLFVGNKDYPSIESIQSFINARLPGYIFNVQDDIIRIYK
jgi:hypothetical protein